MSNTNKIVIPVHDAAKVAAAIRDAHENRVRLAKEEKVARAKAIKEARTAGNEGRVAQLEEKDDRKKSAFMRRKRQLESLERERDFKRLGAAIRRQDRRAIKQGGHSAIFADYEGLAPPQLSRERDLFIEWIPRGFGSGKKRNFSKGRKRATARTSAWKSGEMGRKIRYIFREDALEEVEGNTLTNMGDDLSEAVHCSHVLEGIERLSRSNAQVYLHVFLSLSYENTPEERAAVLAELVRPLRELKLPFCAALHKPDPEGDQRNYHAHVVVSLRPMERIAPYEWEFSTSRSTWLNTPAGLHLQRKFVARTLNRALVAAGHHGKWTWLSRSKRGLQSPGNTKDGPERTRQLRERRETVHDFFRASDAARLSLTLQRAGEMLDQSLQRCVELVRATGIEFRRSIEEISVDLERLAAREASRDEQAKVAVARSETLSVSSRLQELEGDAARRRLGTDDEFVLAAAQDVRMAVINGHIGKTSDGDRSYRVGASDKMLLEAWIALIKTREGQAYCREIIDELPELEDAQDVWPSIRMTRDPRLDGIDADDLWKLWQSQLSKGR